MDIQADAVPEAHLRRNRPALLRAIQEARERSAALQEPRVLRSARIR